MPTKTELITKQHATPIQMPLLHQGMQGAGAGKNTMSSEDMQHTGPIPMPLPHQVNLGMEEPVSRNLNLYENSRLISTGAPTNFEDAE